MSLPLLRPQPLVRLPEPFNDRAWLWELKLDGFRALAYLEQRECRLLSRTGYTYRSFAPLKGALAQELNVNEALLDGEIVCLNAEGRSLFNHALVSAAASRICRVRSALAGRRSPPSAFDGT